MQQAENQEQRGENHLDDIAAAACMAAQGQTERGVGKPGGEDQPRSRKPIIYALPPEYAKLADQARAHLTRSYPHPSGSEKILYRLASQEAGLAALVQGIERQLALRVMLNLDSPRQAMAVAKILKMMSAVGTTVGRRICTALTAASALRTQHRLLEFNANDS